MMVAAGTTKQYAFATSGNPITKNSKPKMFQFKKNQLATLISEDVVNNDRVEICDGPDGCGYAKKSCVCSVQNKQKTSSGPSKIGSSDIGRGFNQTVNFDE